MNNAPGNEAADAEERHHQAFWLRQKQVLDNLKEEMAASEEKLKATLRLQNDLYLKLFPPVRPGRDPTRITGLIEEKKAELERIRCAIQDQQAELNILEGKMDHTSSGGRMDIDPGPNAKDGIDEGRRNLSQLKKDSASAQANLEHLESLLSPIRVLPIEVLAEIFLLCFNEDENGLSTISLTSAPLLVTHICSSWRTVAINKAELWSSISVDIPRKSSVKHEGLVSLVNVWIERSRNRPLRFSIRSDTRKNIRRPHPVFFRVLDLFVPHFLRWQMVKLQSLHLHGRDGLWFPDLPDDATFPILEDLMLNAGEMSDKEAVKLANILQLCPRLHTIHWHIKSIPTCPILPYPQLTKLQLGGLTSLPEMLTILSTAKRLRFLDICTYIPPGNTDTNHAHLVHEALETLDLAYTGELQNLLCNITLPAVTDLTFDQLPPYAPQNVVNGPWPQEGVMTFLRRSNCSLQSFHTIDITITPDDLLVVLHHLSPSLVNFKMEHLRAPCVTDKVLKALTYPSLITTPDDETHVLCPHLRKLKLWGCIEASDGVLADMVESRCNPPPGYPQLAPLESGDFGIHSPLMPRNWERLEKLRRGFEYTVLQDLDP